MMRQFSPVYRCAASAASKIMHMLISTRWEGLENLPAEGGYVVAANHVSEIDGLTLMQPLVDNDIPVRVLCKSTLFKIPVLGWLMRQAGQVPVYRGSARSGDALRAAKQALRDGEVIAIFPEGTLTRDPNYWPMTGKTGVGYLALAGDEPVIPVAQWGAHYVWGRYDRFPNLRGRQLVTVQIGKPIDVSDLREMDDQHEAARLATDRILTEITKMLSEIRGEEAPSVKYDTRKYGDPGKKALGKISAAERRAFRARAAGDIHN